jgi:hypothetical protein
MHTPPIAAITGLALSSTRLISSLWGAEFPNVGAAGKAASGANQNDGAHRRIGVGPFYVGDQGLTHLEAQTIHRRIVEFDDGDSAENLVASLTRCHSLFHCAERGSVFRRLM